MRVSYANVKITQQAQSGSWIDDLSLSYSYQEPGEEVPYKRKLNKVGTSTILMKHKYPTSYCYCFGQMKYLPVCSTSDNAPIICVWHDLCLKNIVSMTRMKRELFMPRLPIPEYNTLVIRSRNQNITTCIEAYSIDTASVLCQLPVEIQAAHKILGHIDY